MLWFWPRLESKDHTVILSSLSPAGVGTRMERRRQKLVGQDKGSLTETANKANSKKNSTDKENIQNKQRNAQSNSHGLMPCALLSSDSLSPQPAPQPEASMAAHGIKYPVCLASWFSEPGCVTSWLLLKINLVLAEPRTINHLKMCAVYYYQKQAYYFTTQQNKT